MSEKSVLEVIRENYSKIYTAERKVASYVLNHPTEAVDINVAQLARKITEAGLNKLQSIEKTGSLDMTWLYDKLAKSGCDILD